MQRLLFRQLRGAMLEAGINQYTIAKELGLSIPSVSMRFCGRIQWRIDEMYAVLRLIGKPDSELHIYFPRPGNLNRKESDSEHARVCKASF